MHIKFLYLSLNPGSASIPSYNTNIIKLLKMYFVFWFGCAMPRPSLDQV